MKVGKITDYLELQRQVSRQIEAYNKIIEMEGIEGLQQRIRAYTPEMEAAGRAYTKTLEPAGQGLSWLHEPDMGGGGGPCDVGGVGSSRINSIVGAQAITSIARQILGLPKTTIKLEGTIIINLPPEPRE